MTRDQVREMLDRVLTWPLEAQGEAVASLAAIVEQFAALHRKAAVSGSTEIQFYGILY